MIGLVDLQFQQCLKVSLCPPNIEIMKLANYYKTEEKIFCRLVDLNETNLDNYDKIYVFSESNKYTTVPTSFMRAKNIIYGGTAFTNGVYIPFENSLIDYTLPRTFIYKEFLKDKYNDGIKANVISHILDDTYYRRYAGEYELPIPPIQKNKRVILYDVNFFQPNWLNLINEIKNRHASKISTIHPIVCKNLEDFFTVRAQDIIFKTNEIILDIEIPLDEFPYLIKKYKNLLLAEIMQSSNIFITLGNTFSSNFQYYKDMIYKLNLLYLFWSNNIPIKIKYIEPLVGTKDPLAPLSNVIATWSSKLENKRSINERITYKDKKRKSEAQIARDQLLKFHPTAKDLFDQTFSKIIARRYWRI